MCTEPDVINMTAIIYAAAEAYNLSDAVLRSRDRDPLIVQARWVAFLACEKAGAIPAQIAHEFGMSHSTVVHGLARAKCHPRLVRRATHASLAGSLDGQITLLIERFPLGQRTPVAHYIHGTLRGTARVQVGARWGLAYLLAQPRLCVKLCTLLDDAGEGCHVGRMRAHAAACRLEWMA